MAENIQPSPSPVGTMLSFMSISFSAGYFTPRPAAIGTLQ
jgi:hypothetical protein